LKKYNDIIESCLAEASKAWGKVSPNPLVGAVLTDDDGKIISSGFHEKCGCAHAEVNAIKKAGKKAENATLFVNLEPCSHFGKTPPCVDLIIKSHIKKVVIGMQDPNPKVNGEGIRKLREAGIEVVTGILEEKCKKFNEIFIVNQTENRTFLAVKTATTLDGKIATAQKHSKWITSEKAREKVHMLRNKYDAIMTSSATVLADNPEMTCRIKGGRNPVRIVADRNLKTDLNAKIYTDNGAKVYIAIDENLKNLPKLPSHIEFIKCPTTPEGIDLKFLVKELYNKGIMSILAEAGGKFNGALLKEHLVDKIYHFTAPKILGDDNAISWVNGFAPERISDAINLKLGEIERCNKDILVEYYTQK